MLKGWAFRGYEKSEWSLYSTLSRYFQDFKIKENTWYHQEQRNLRIFQRKSKAYQIDIPDINTTFEWLSLMQHFGAATRLIDFTWSPYIAAFFALEKAKEDSAIWAINFNEIKQWSKKSLANSNFQIENDRLGFSPRTFYKYDEFFLKNKYNFIGTGEPFNINKRMIAQSGTFIIPSILNKPIENIIKINFQQPSEVLMKIILNTKKMREQTMNQLYFMNISNSTLFPDLSGLARSLNYELEWHWGFDKNNLEEFRNYLDRELDY